MTKQTDANNRVYIASLNGGKSDGLLLYRLDADAGGLRLEASFRDGAQNPLYTAINRQQQSLFVADFVESCDGKPGGAVCAYAIHPATGALTFRGRRSSEGTVPCYVSVSANGKFVLVANYGDGSVAVLPVRANGELGDAVSVERHASPAGSPKRQAHAHSIVLDPANRFAFVGELGLDKVMAYRFEDTTGKLTPSTGWEARNGAGPRHFVFHPDGRRAYLINETDSTVVAFAYDAEAGKLSELQIIETLPRGFDGKNYTADLHVHPNGRFLYGSNRGHESIVLFAIAPDNGRLTLIGHESTRGNFPRGFGIDPTGAFLLAANEKSGNIVVFRLDPKTGKLTATGRVTNAPAPACVSFL